MTCETIAVLVSVNRLIGYKYRYRYRCMDRIDIDDKDIDTDVDLVENRLTWFQKL